MKEIDANDVRKFSERALPELDQLMCQFYIKAEKKEIKRIKVRTFCTNLIP